MPTAKRFGQSNFPHMIKRIQILILLILTPQILFSQRISVGASYFNTDAFFLKSIPGVTLGYEHQISKFNIFGNAHAGIRDYAYTESSGFVNHIIQTGSGEVFKGGINLGASYNMISSEHYQISVGSYLGINYIQRVEDCRLIAYEIDHPVDLSYKSIDEWHLNRLGWGVSVDVEVKHVLLDQLSVFTRIEAGQTRLKDEIASGIPFEVNGYNGITFSWGVKYNLERKYTGS